MTQLFHIERTNIFLNLSSYRWYASKLTLWRRKPKQRPTSVRKRQNRLCKPTLERSVRCRQDNVKILPTWLRLVPTFSQHSNCNRNWSFIFHMFHRPRKRLQLSARKAKLMKRLWNRVQTMLPSQFTERSKRGAQGGAAILAIATSGDSWAAPDRKRRRGSLKAKDQRVS